MVKIFHDVSDFPFFGWGTAWYQETINNTLTIKPRMLPMSLLCHIIGMSYESVIRINTVIGRFASPIIEWENRTRNLLQSLPQVDFRTPYLCLQQLRSSITNGNMDALCHHLQFALHSRRFIIQVPQAAWHLPGDLNLCQLLFMPVSSLHCWLPLKSSTCSRCLSSFSDALRTLRHSGLQRCWIWLSSRTPHTGTPCCGGRIDQGCTLACGRGLPSHC